MTTMIDRLSASLADRYRIERELGEGGVATVYLAQDLKHERHVALKVLKPELAAVVGADRFLAEIKTTAHLQHPHIVALYDSGQADGFLYFVMPYIEGETLRDRLQREQPLPVDEAVRIATEVAEALHAAHEQGVIHRDVKPANILLSRGRPLVADFGIALAVSAAGGTRLTETGLSMGTPHYMSPEQATAEKQITARSDVYSLGAVLYEMLTGEPPHTGPSVQAIVFKIVSEETVEVMRRRKAVPGHVAAAVAKALEKLPADRFDSAKAFAEALGNPGFRHGGDEHAAAQARRSRTWALLGALAVLLLAVVVWAASGPRDPGVPRSYPMAFRGAIAGGSLSPDGSTLAYVARDERDTRRVMLHPWGGVRPVPVAGTEGIQNLPVWSPDGSELAFTQNGETMIVGVAGGVPRSVMKLECCVTAWEDGRLYQGGGNFVLAVPATGGAVDTVMATETGSSYFRVRLLDLLPGGAYGLVRKGEGERWDLFILDMRTGKLADRPLVRSQMATYVSSGHLLFVGPYPDYGLFGAAFDHRTVTMGPPIALIPKVSWFSISENGTLFYAVNHASHATSTPVWVRRDGGQREVVEGWEIEPADASGLHGKVALSADGRSLVVSVGPIDLTDFWLVDLATEGRRRITDLDAGTRDPRWSDDGRRLVFLSQAQGRYGIWSMPVDGSSAPAPVISLAGKLASSPDVSFPVKDTR